MQFIDLKAQYHALRDTIDTRIACVLAHGQFILGPEVRELEERLAAYTGAKHCITAASGSHALQISLMALERKPGDEVITTPFSFAAALEAVALLGGRAVFVDVEPDTANIDASMIEAAITPRTRAILPASMYGQPPDMTAINAIAAPHALPVIEDAAQSFGACDRSLRSCNLCTIGCTSFYPSKPLGCYGDGGAIFTSDDALATAMREIRSHGQERGYRHTRIGVNGRLDSIQCAVLLAKLDRFDWEIERRQAIGARYDNLLRERAPKVRLLRVKPGRTCIYAQYTARVANRDQVRAKLTEAGIPTAAHYPLALHHQPAYAAMHRGESYPVAEQLAREVMSLPMYPDLDEATQDKIVEAVGRATG